MATENIDINSVSSVASNGVNTTMAQQKKTFDALKSDLGYTNVMQAPRVTKIIVGTGVGSVKDKKHH